jgi:hypothetical protein
MILDRIITNVFWCGACLNSLPPSRFSHNSKCKPNCRTCWRAPCAKEEHSALFFWTAKFHQKEKFKCKILKLKQFFRGFNCQKWEGEGKDNNCQISLFGLQNIARNTERWLKIILMKPVNNYQRESTNLEGEREKICICISYLVYNQIWLNLPLATFQ